MQLSSTSVTHTPCSSCGPQLVLSTLNLLHAPCRTSLLFPGPDGQWVFVPVLQYLEWKMRMLGTVCCWQHRTAVGFKDTDRCTLLCLLHCGAR